MVTKAMLIDKSKGKIYKFLFNPHQISDSYSVDYEIQDVQNAVIPPLTYKRGEPREMTITCRLLSPPLKVEDVKNFIEFVQKSALPPAAKKAPPALWLSAGILQLPVRIKSWDINYNDWYSNLMPKDVEMNITFYVGEFTFIANSKKTTSKSKSKSKTNVTNSPLVKQAIDELKAYTQIRSNQRPKK